jgi:predicted Zn-dependent protease
VCAVIVVTLALSADYLTKYVPFRYEQAMFDGRSTIVPEPDEFDQQLKPLADRIAHAMDLPDDMRITVHYADVDEVNAYATFGGHVVINRGLIEKLPNENALAMVMAHEIAHIKHRHPIRSLGRTAVVLLAVMAVAGVQGNEVAGTLAGDAGTLTLLTFNRGQESEADRSALEAVAGVYGHVAGALDLYTVLLEEKKKRHFDAPMFLSTHPLTQDRIQRLKSIQYEKGWDDSPLATPLVGINGVTLN